MTPPESTVIHADCRHYRGDKPCRHNRLCGGCAHYQPFEGRVAIVKIGALGDVIRTLCILPELRRRHPNAQITWITSPSAAAFIRRHPLIDRIVTFDALAASALEIERFDLAIGLDKEAGPCALTMRLNADRKLGVGWSDHGTPIPLNGEAVPYFQLGLSDELKFHANHKGYPQLVYEALGWEYTGQRYELPLDPAAGESARTDLTRMGWRSELPTLGIHMGAGRVFANKMWPVERIIALLRDLRARHAGLQFLLLGGDDERTALDKAHAQLPWTLPVPTGDDAQLFIAAIELCDTLFSGDTLAMHLAIARSRGVVAWFGPTCEQEIDQFGLGEKLVARVPCSPCYKGRCDRGDVCLSAVTVTEAADAVMRVLEKRWGAYRLTEAARGAEPAEPAGTQRYRLAG